MQIEPIDYTFHVHDNLQDLLNMELTGGRKYAFVYMYSLNIKAPSIFSFDHRERVYIMQCNRVVFVGSNTGAINFMKWNEGKFCKDIRIKPFKKVAPKILTDTAAIEFFNHYCNTGEYLDKSVKGGYWFENGIWLAFDSSSGELFQECFKSEAAARNYANGSPTKNIHGYTF